MKLLRTDFNQDGCNLKQLLRRGNVALFEKQHIDTNHTSYEVVVIRIRPEHMIGNITIPEREAYPSSSEWGTFGWTYSDIPSSREKFESLALAAAGQNSLDNSPS